MARRRKKQRTPWVIGAIVAALAIYWFFLRDTADQGIEVQLSAEATVEDEVLMLSGTTNVPDNAVLVYQLTPETNDAQAVEGTTTVMGGEFSETVDVADFPEGEITVEVFFQAVLDDTPQPPEIVETYGALGQHIAGEHVVEGELGRRAEVSLTVTRP